MKKLCLASKLVIRSTKLKRYSSTTVSLFVEPASKLTIVSADRDVMPPLFTTLSTIRPSRRIHLFSAIWAASITDTVPTLQSHSPYLVSSITDKSNSIHHDRVIYNAVLDAQREVYKVVKPGVNWGDCHLIAEKTIVQHLH